MGRYPGRRGVYAVDWTQTELEGETGAAPALYAPGLEWCFRGPVRRLDPGPDALWLDRPAEPVDRRGRARNRIRRLALAEALDAAEAAPDTALPEIDMLAGSAFALTDGRRRYHARIIETGSRRLAVFDPVLPAPGRRLWLTEVRLAPPGQARNPGVICFLPGTLIDTPAGPRPVEDLNPGDPVLTRDNGARPLVWCGQTRLSGAELFLHPRLRPVRLRAGVLGSGRPGRDLLVSPGHRLILRVPATLCAEREVLVQAEDLQDGHAIRRDFSVAGVVYHHLMFERHEIITAEGMDCESFHPGLADPMVLKWHARTLERARPGTVAAPGQYGPVARPCPGPGEAAILRMAV